MKDLTKGSVVMHVLSLAMPAMTSMMAQFLCQLIDLYFVARIDASATAGVNLAGNLVLIVAAFTQILSVGTVTLIAQAVGRADQQDANLLFNQALVLSLVLGLVGIVCFYGFMRVYLGVSAADGATADAGAVFIHWVLPAHIFGLPMAVLTSYLRAIGTVKPAIVLYFLTVALNGFLAPVLIAGVGTNMPLGVKGAGLATSVSTFIGVTGLAMYVSSAKNYVSLRKDLMRPQLLQWRRLVKVGVPVGAEVLLTFLSAGAAYYAIRTFGASAQAGFGIGWRIVQLFMLPGVTVAFAAGPIVAQSFGARDGARVREVFRKTLLLAAATMVFAMAIAQWRPEAILTLFGADRAAQATAMSFLQPMSWVFVAQAVICTCAGVFQGLGNTVPSLISSCTCLVAFALPALWLSTQPMFRLVYLWYLLMFSVVGQALLSLALLRAEFARKVRPLEEVDLIIGRTYEFNEMAVTEASRGNSPED